MNKRSGRFLANMILLASVGLFAGACIPLTEAEPLNAASILALTVTFTSTPTPTPTLIRTPTPTSPPTPAISLAKQTIIAFSTIMAATENAIPTVEKPSPATLDPNASCPMTPLPIGIFPYDAPGPFFSGDTIENRAVVKSSAGFYYEIWAGAPESDPNKGLIRVFEDDPDYCASSVKGTVFPGMQDFIAPNGPIILTKIAGDEIWFRTPGGKTGRFNFVTGTYLH